MGDTRPRNRQDLVERLETRWKEVLDADYIQKVCEAAWDRLRRIKEAKGSYLKPKDVDRVEEESSSDDD